MNKLIVLIDCYQPDIISLLRQQKDTLIVLVESKVFQYEHLLRRVIPIEKEKKISEDQIEELYQLNYLKKKLVINCTDQSMLLRHKIDSILCLPGQFLDSRVSSYNKYNILKLLFDAGVVVNRPFLIQNYDDYQAIRPQSDHICKPIWGGGSIGIALNQSPRSFPAILQNFFIGDEYALDYYTREGIHHLCTVWKYVRSNQTDIKKNRIDLVYQTNVSEINLMHDYCKKSLDTVGLQNGLAHVEVKVNTQKKIEIIEINFRFQGHTPYSTLQRLKVSNQLDSLINQHMPQTESSHGIYLSRFILQTKTSHQSNIQWNQVKNLSSFQEIHSNYSEDTRTFLKTNDSRSYIAYITLANTNKTALEDDLNYLNSLQTQL